MSKKKDTGATPSAKPAEAGTTPSKSPKSRSLLKAAAEEVRLTRRLLVSFLLAGAASPVLGQDARKAVTAVDARKITLPRRNDLQVMSPDAFRLADNLTEFTLIRPRDLVVLNIRLVNATISGSGKNRKIRRNGSRALMIVQHQPQAIMESTWPDTKGQAMPDVQTDETVAVNPDPGDKLPIARGDTARAYIAGPSRLAYIMPSGTSEIDFTAQAVLDACASWPLNLDTRAGTVPGDMVELHAFDQIRDRLTVIANQQKAALHAYPAVEALLKRAARKVAEAIASSADAGIVLSDEVIDDLIDYEIKATLDPGQISAAEAKVLQPMTSRSGQKFKLYVNAEATKQLAQNRRVTQTRGGLTGNVMRVEQSEDRKPLENGSVNPNATDIEIPFRLHMTPLSTAGFTHASDVVDHGSPFTELWHTRMGTRVSDWVLGDTPQPLRAVHTDDGQFEVGFCLGDTFPCPTWPLDPRDRRDLVALMSAPTTLDGTPRTPLPATARHLRLTALGGSMDAEGLWNDNLALDSDLVAWKHITSIGRDQFVRVIYDGFLYPFGHAASLIKVSERKFSGQSDGGRVAAVLQKYYIIVRQRLRTFPGDGQMWQGRDFPFTRVEITTKQTPDMQAPVMIAPLGVGYYGSATNAFQTFWPKQMAGGSDILFHMIFSDAAGRQTVADMPLIFISGTRNQKASSVQQVSNYYNGNDATVIGRRKLALDRQLIRLTPAVDPEGGALEPGESDYHTSELVFRAAPASGAPDGAHFYPGILNAQIEVPALKNLLGHAANPTIGYHQIFLSHGLGGGNPAEVVFSFTPLAVPSVQDKPTDKFGGLLAPSLKPDGLSRKLGVLNDVGKYLAPDGNLPLDALSGMKLLGVVDIKDILKPLLLTGKAAGVPQLKTVTTGTEVTTTYDLTQANVDTPSTGLGLFVAKDYGGTADNPQLRVVSTVVVTKDGSPPQARVEASLKAFKINLFGFIILNFQSLSLTVKPGSKPEVDPIFDIDNGVMFGGPLEFLNGFRSFIPMDGFSDPPGLDVGPGGISASYSLGLPDIGVGALTLQNVNLGAGFDLPFNGDGPTARFNFAERHNPFNLTVSMLGGGGFFAIRVGSGGVQELEAALEFGAQVSIDLGVASGGVYVKAGFYFHWIGQPADKQMISFEGYIELGGHLSVLGIITVSLTFHLGLTYEKTSNKTRLYGTATLTVEIDILFFSISQDISVERQFAGSDADPLFLDFVPKKQMWADYCSAFA
ncbi:hypothetical protein ABAC460_17000 [Asticcacaulis sp. AC460]|uniref:hypothetical protein n=1 Tax=Asticcacaulis sp. AC460 TaxID=1282360 RepID=UPI0003C40F5A|nr:hypothetical protein [Asticcacaulis sp. AC460]ESQ88358.1 hypothetical protein ABAC460_17000 [Asticcacaulis sp. AC460]